MRKLVMMCAGAAALLAAVPSSATTLLFKMNEIGGNGEKYRFMLDSHPSIVTSNVLGAVVGRTNITGSGPGVGNNYIYFGYLSGLQIRSGTGLASAKVGALLGNDLTTGTGSSMTLNKGNFLIGGLSGAFNVNVSGVPEAGTWAMMIAGFGLAGFAMRARRQSVMAAIA